MENQNEIKDKECKWRMGMFYLNEGDRHHQDHLLAENFFQSSKDAWEASNSLENMEEDGKLSNSREEFFFHEIEPEQTFY